MRAVWGFRGRVVLAALLLAEVLGVVVSVSFTFRAKIEHAPWTSLFFLCAKEETIYSLSKFSKSVFKHGIPISTFLIVVHSHEILKRHQQVSWYRAPGLEAFQKAKSAF